MFYKFEYADRETGKHRGTELIEAVSLEAAVDIIETMIGPTSRISTVLVQPDLVRIGWSHILPGRDTATGMTLVVDRVREVLARITCDDGTILSGAEQADVHDSFDLNCGLYGGISNLIAEHTENPCSSN